MTLLTCRWVRDAAEAGLERVEESEAYAQAVMNLLLANRNLGPEEDGTNVSPLQQKLHRLRQVCPGDWRGHGILHVCSLNGCDCADIQAATDVVVDALLQVSFGAPRVPALNKWLSVYPVLAEFCFMRSFHDILLPSLRGALNASDQDFGAGDDLQDDPHDDNGNIEVQDIVANDEDPKVKRKRACKALHWMSTRGTQKLLAMFTQVIGPAMRLHYSLFKYANNITSSAESLLFRFTHPHTSMVAPVLRDLCTLFQSRNAWGPLLAEDAWDDAFMTMARQCVLMLVGQVTSSAFLLHVLSCLGEHRRIAFCWSARSSISASEIHSS